MRVYAHACARVYLRLYVCLYVIVRVLGHVFVSECLRGSYTSTHVSSRYRWCVNETACGRACGVRVSWLRVRMRMRA